MGSLIKDHVRNIIKRQLAKRGIVVWYDPDKTYKDMVSKDDFMDIPCIQFDGSYYNLRFKTEEYFKGIEKSSLLIYLNCNRDIVNFPLIELEKAGAVVEPTSPLERNTSLTAVVKSALAGKINPVLMAEICRKVEEKTVSIDEIEKIAENAKSVDTAALSIIFKSNDPQTIILSFITNTEFDKLVRQKKIEKELAKLINVYLGIESEDIADLGKLRDKTAEVILMVDYIKALKDESCRDKYKRLGFPIKSGFRENITGLVDLWRKRSDIDEEFIKRSEEIQKTFRIDDEVFKPSDIIEVETFPVIDEKLINNSLDVDIDKREELNQIKEIAGRRKSLFWASKRPEYSLLWLIIEYSVNLLIYVRRISEEVNKQTLNLPDIIKSYVEIDSGGWHLVDKYYRLMESKYADFDIGTVFDDKLEKFIVKCRKEYSKFISMQTSSILSCIESTKMLDIKGVTQQRDIFRHKILPRLEERKKCAYFLVDAFRYEMGEDFFLSMESCERKNISCALTGFPTITSFGMLSLILWPGDTINIQADSKRFGLEVDGAKVSNRSERIKYISQKCGFNTDVFKLEEVIKPKKAVRDAVKKTDLLIVTSQEIDSVCESGDELIAKQMMDNIFLQMKRAIYHLAELGVERFVITADHGYLLGNEIGKDSKVDVPGGETFLLHKRVWIGKGGDNPENTVRFKASDFGYKSDLEFVFPRTLAVFKTPGGENNYFHGGISLQEMVIPIVEIQMKPSPKKKPSIKERYSVTLPKDVITNRIFTVTVLYEIEELLFADMLLEAKRVRLRVIKNEELVGQAETSEYGFDEATKEIVLQPNKKNVATIILNENVTKGAVDVCLIDSKTELELAKNVNVQLKIMI